MNISTGIITTVIDSAGRPLVILRRTPKGQLLYIFKRYKNMTDDDKSVIREAYKLSCQNNSNSAELQVGTNNIEDFLAFSDNNLCG